MGLTLSSTYHESFPPKSRFSVNDIPDLSGKVMIVTGGNTGIGKETVRVLLARNARVYLAARSETKAKAAIKDLQQLTGKEAIHLPLDLSNLKSIKAAAEEFKSKESALHVLFNSAGVMVPPIEQTTLDGYDLQFGTNVLGHFYFTKLLIPALLEGAKTSSDGKARVVTTSSIAHVYKKGLNFSTFRDGPTRTKVGTQGLYMQSKFGNVVFANELARRYGDNIVSCSLNPGFIKTDLQRHMSWTERILLKLVLYPVEYGAFNQLYAGTSPQGVELNGKYIIPFARVGKARPETMDPDLGKELWNWCEEQVKGI